MPGIRERFMDMICYILFRILHTVNGNILISGGARIRVEGGQNLYKIYAFYAHISYVFKKKKK